MSFATLLHQRIGNWSQRRYGEDVSPVTLTTRRIYILPTRLGLMYALAVVAMGIGGMNYDNNLALLLAFLLASLGFVAMHHTHRNLAGLLIHALPGEPVFAGQLTQINIGLENTSSQTRLALQASTLLNQTEHASAHITAPAQGHTTLLLPVPTQRRGWLLLPRLVISTRYPFGLFRSWTVLHLPLKMLVYPRPSDTRTTSPPPGFDNQDAQYPQHGDDEFAGLRPFHAGDSSRRIAWKAYARDEELKVRQYTGARRSACMLDWDALHGLDVETRLSQLCRWIIDLHAQSVRYGLKLSGHTIAPALNEAHRAQCLKMLATFQGGV